MLDTHLTTPLNRDPFRQYRVGELEVHDLSEVGPELRHVLKSRGEPEDYEVFEELLRTGGRIAMASRLTAVEAPHGPSALEVEAVSVRTLSFSLPKVYRRNQDTPDELVRYLEAYLAEGDPEHRGLSLDRASSILTQDSPKTSSRS
jgi:hypothetical protein